MKGGKSVLQKGVNMQFCLIIHQLVEYSDLQK